MSMHPITAALLISNRQLWEQAHLCIQNLPVRIALEQNGPGDIEELLDRIERHNTDVVLLEGNLLTVPLDEFIRRLRNTASQPAVFVFHLEASPQHILEAMRAGASEYLYPPLGDPLKKAFERLSAERQRTSATPSSGLGRIHGFISAAGGCGATTFACHTAAEAARQTKAQVLLGDFDFDAALVRFVMKSKASYSVRDALDNLHRMDASYWKALISTHGLLDVIPAPEDLAAKRPGDSKETAHLMRFIRSTYQTAVVDFGRHVSSAALDSLPEIDTLYILTSPQLEHLDRVRDCISMAMEREFPASRVKVLLNKVADKGSMDPKGAEKFLGAPVAGSFPDDSTALYDAWSEGHLLDGGTKLGQALTGLTRQMLSRATPAKPETTAAAPTAPAGMKRFFSFLQRSTA